MIYSGSLHIIRLIATMDPATRAYLVIFEAPTAGPLAGPERTVTGDRGLQEVLVVMGLEPAHARQVVMEAATNQTRVTVQDVRATPEVLRALNFR